MSPEQPNPPTDETKQHVHAAAAELARAAEEHGRQKLGEAKARAADRADEIAEAVDATADELAAVSGDEALSGYGRSFAAMVRQLAGGLRERDVDDFANELAELARRSPGAFLAGSVALGFGLSRFLRASADHPAHEYPETTGVAPQGSKHDQGSSS